MPNRSTYRSLALFHPLYLRASPTEPIMETKSLGLHRISPLPLRQPDVQHHKALNQGLVQQLSTAVNTLTGWSLRKAQRNVSSLSSCHRYPPQRLPHLSENCHCPNCGRQHLSIDLRRLPYRPSQVCAGSTRTSKWVAQWKWRY